MKNFMMKKSITQKYPAKAESILSSCFVIKPATNFSFRIPSQEHIEFE